MKNEAENYLYHLQILYVEDEDETRDELSQFLRRRTGRIYTARNGKEGLEKYKEHNPDIVIADLLMPVMSGMQMIRQIRELDENCHIVITSTRGDAESILKTVDVGITKYVVKPIDTDELIRALEEIALKIARKKNLAILFEGEKKKQTEDEIKRYFSFFIKNCTGKGPKDVKVFLHDHQIDIYAYDVLTTIEKNLLSSGQNHVLVEQLRKVLYSAKSEETEAFIAQILDRPVKLHQTIIDPYREIDRIVFLVL